MRGEALKRLEIAERAKELIRLRSVRRGLLEKCGEKAFLDPKNLKFPIVSLLSKDCSPDCKMLHAAYNRAKEWHYEGIANEAAKLYKANKCEEELGIKIHE